MQYILNPDLPLVKENFPGNPIFKGRFANGSEPDQPMPFTTIVKWQFLDKNPQQEEKKLENFSLPTDPSGVDFLDNDQDGIIWLGHATFFIRINGKGILTDPVFWNIPMVKRQSELPFAASKLEGKVDYLLISHGHFDHFNNKSVRMIMNTNPGIQVKVPLELSSIFPVKSNGAIQEAGWWQEYSSEEINIFFLPAKHWHRRGMFDFNKVLWGSFLIRSGNTTIYFCGDSAYDEHFKEIENIFGPLDICLMPVGAYKPSYIMKEAHMSPAEAVDAFHDLKGKIFIPMHYGTFDLADEPLGEPVKLLEELRTEQMINGELKILKAGEVFQL